MVEEIIPPGGGSDVERWQKVIYEKLSASVLQTTVQKSIYKKAPLIYGSTLVRGKWW